MKKNYLLLLSTILIFGATQAQVKFGIGGGPQNTSIDGNGTSSAQFSSIFTPRLSYRAGAFAEFHLDKKQNWAIQPALVYSVKGGNFGGAYDSLNAFHSDSSAVFGSWKQNNIELPVNLLFRAPLSKKVRFVVGGGAYAAYQLSAKTNFSFVNASGEHTTFTNRAGNEQIDNANYKKFNYGLQGTAGFEFNERVSIMANYAKGLSNFYEGQNAYKHELWGATAIVWLSKSKASVTRDSDGDGVPDKQDKCPNEPGTTATNGCPDTDGDGIPDIEDKCPSQFGLAELGGCPLPDQDGDGIPDREDKCPTQAGLAKYGGCPAPDTDGDGINDEEDKCPNEPGSSRYNGCPVPDTDGDGINDEEDECPTVAGKGKNGCPGAPQEVLDDISKAAAGIIFAVNSDKINPSSHNALDKIAAHMLKDNNIKLEIEGHSDNTGAERHNQILSGRRALAIKVYLVKKGIDTNRITAKGYGSERPIADNNTEAGRAKNRRVEFKISY